jgi:DNA-binding transcriptional regulator YdaS (Cro superfamily)
MVATRTPPDWLKEAVRIVGSQSALGRLLGVTQASVWAWLKDGKPLPTGPVAPTGELNWVLKVEQATGVSRHDLRPDLYPRESTDESTPAGAALDHRPAPASALTGLEPAR